LDKLRDSVSATTPAKARIAVRNLNVKYAAIEGV